MSPGEKTDSWIVALATELRAELAAARAQVGIAREERSKWVDPWPGLASMALISVCLDRAYSALEAAFLRVARTLDGTAPSGDHWHKALLHQMTLAIQDRRPAVLTQESAALLEALRRHRHSLRHSHAAPVQAAGHDLQDFLSFLEGRGF